MRDTKEKAAGLKPDSSQSERAEQWTAQIALLRSGKREVVSIPLPFTAGSSLKEDALYIHSAAVGPQEFTVWASQGALKVAVAREKKGEGDDHTTDATSLLEETFYVELLGATRRPGSSLHCLVARERNWSQRRGKLWRGLSLCEKSTPFRVTALLATAVPMVAFALAVTQKDPVEAVQLSHVENTLTVGSTLETVFGGNTKSYDSHREGVRFRVPLAPEVQGRPGVFSFSYGGVDLTRELVVKANSAEVGSVNPKQGCERSYCEAQFSVPGHLTAGADSLLLEVEHSDHRSIYLIYNTAFQLKHSWSETLDQSVMRKLLAAEEAYSHRKVARYSLVHSRAILNSLQESFDHYEAPESRQAQFDALKKQVHDDLAKILEDEIFAFRKQLRLGNRNAARERVATLLKFFPDPVSEDGRRVRELESELMRSTKGN